MPEMDGLQAARQIIQKGQYRPIIVALTANTLCESRQEYFDAGMQMVIHKPVNKAAFEQALQLLTTPAIQSSSSLSSKPVFDLS